MKEKEGVNGESQSRAGIQAREDAGRAKGLEKAESKENKTAPRIGRGKGHDKMILEGKQNESGKI